MTDAATTDSIWIVDADTRYSRSMKRRLESLDREVVLLSDGESALSRLDKEAPLLLVVESQLPDMSGIDILKAAKQHEKRVPVIVIAAYSTTQAAIDSMREGAYDYLLKPKALEVIDEVARNALSGLETRNIVILSEVADADLEQPNAIVGRSPEMVEIYKLIGQVSETDAAVLIQGETGTGKDLVARAIHDNSPRSERPFLAVNCAAIPETLLESELFGHERGAFTGAHSRKIGKFEHCHGGTILLDEIGDMSPATQSKILRVLQHQSFERVGGRETIHTNVRVIAATNKSLVRCIRDRTFRVDLFYRLKVVSIFLPPLRDRREDIALLAEYFLKKFCRSMNRRLEGISSDAMERLIGYSWPGNVRELENTIQTAVALTKNNVLSLEDFPIFQPGYPGVEQVGDSLEKKLEELINSHFPEIVSLHKGNAAEYLVGLVERVMVARTLDELKGNQVHAAKLLGLSRNTLRKRIEKFELART
jgi:DNA-binding NtrC family response regulator